MYKEGIICLNFGMSHHLHPYFVYASNEVSGEVVHFSARSSEP